MRYLNVNIPVVNYQKTLNRRIYVDKSLLIEPLNGLIGTDDCYVCITRPRRFGKTINANMLGAYYTKNYDSRKLFEKLEIAKTATFPEHLNRHNVIYMDLSRMPDICLSYENYIADILEGMKEDLSQGYPQVRGKTYSRLSLMLQETGDSFIFILDEWDSIFYKKFMSADDKDAYLAFLKNLLKDQPYVELAYMTGVLPIAKYSSGSELNMFREYNFMNDYTYEAYFGLNEDEVKNLCQSSGSVSYEELKMWYDGYHMKDGRSLFNPRSVNCALTDGVCQSYWTETGPMNEIAGYIEHNVDEVREDIVKMVASILETVHDREIPFLKYSDENSLSCVITLCYLYARKDYQIEREAKSGKGYCDYLFFPKKQEMPAILLELKVGGSCEDAIAQIKDKKYIQKAEGCNGILLVGINYDKEKHHQCQIERLKMG